MAECIPVRWCTMCQLTDKKRVHAVCSCVECEENLCAKHHEDPLYKVTSHVVSLIEVPPQYPAPVKCADHPGTEETLKGFATRATLSYVDHVFLLESIAGTSTAVLPKSPSRREPKLPRSMARWLCTTKNLQ